MKVFVNSFLVLIAALFIGCSESGTGLSIRGNVEFPGDSGFVKLELIGEKGPVPVDTVEINSNGNYELKPEVTEPSFYRLNFNDRQYVVLILTGQETEVEVNVHGNEPTGYSEVSGSYDTQYMRDMDELSKTFKEEVNQLNQRAIEARTNGDVDSFQALNVEYQGLNSTHTSELKKIIWESLPSLAAFYGVQQLDPEANFAFFDSVSIELTRELPTNKMVSNLSQMVNTRRSLSIGSVAPEIALPNPDGEIVKLSSLRGKYVLIDFWAAWCRPCRAENPNVVRMYNAYSNQNFEILGVSLDKTKGAWLKAIEQDELPWQHVSDLKFWNSIAARTYQVNAIPATYLVDPEGKIIAKNLRGKNLEEKLKEIFG